jgi:Peptidase A4 family
MHFRIRWARTLTIASGLTLLVAATMPASASAHPVKRSDCGTAAHRCKPSGGHANASLHAPSKAKPQASQARGRTLIFGSGDTADAGPPLNINPNEPLINLSNILANAGYGVDVDESSTLPARIKQYRSIWYISTNPLSASDQSELETFVGNGGSVYLTGAGPNPCCASLNAADQTVIDALISDGDVQVGNQGFADDGSEPETVNSSAIDDVALIPNVLTTWTPSQPGGMSDIPPSNQLTTTSFTNGPAPTGAVWDGSSMVSGKGRVAILMDITWLESEFWDQSTAAEMAANLERFLMSALPVPAVANAKWAGFAAKAHGVQDVNGEWTVPTVVCSDPEPSAIRIWVGIDGFGNSDLANAGVGVTCASPTASPCYYLFTGVHTGNETPVTGCGGVAPGDVVSVDVANNTFGSSTFIATISVNGNELNGQPFTLTEPSKRDKSAECVVELPPGLVGPSPAAHYTEVADFTTPVTFTDCSATATANAGDALDTESLVMGSDGAFTVDALNLGGNANPRATTTAPAYPSLAWQVNWVRD